MKKTQFPILEFSKKIPFEVSRTPPKDMKIQLQHTWGYIVRIPSEILIAQVYQCHISD